jgi:transposase
MRELHDLKADDLQGLAPEVVASLATQMLARLREQDRHIEQRDQRIERQAHEIRFKESRIEKLTFELARHKAWRFGAKTEAMSAEQRALFEETLTEDEASLLAQLQQARGDNAAPSDATTKRKPRRQPLPDHLRRVEHHHEPEDTTCPTPNCGRPMQRVGEDISERLDIVPAEFFVHRHIYGKWTCRCCERLVQQPAEPQIIDGGMPASGLLAHTLISRFVDHLPYYRQETINARSGVHTPRSTLAAWSGRAGAALGPLYEAHKRFVLAAAVLHADETPVAMLDPGAGKTKRAYVWGYARGAFDPVPGVIYDFCVGRGAQFPRAFLGDGGDDDPRERSWRGPLVRDEYKAYESVIDAVPDRFAAGCLAHYPEHHIRRTLGVSSKSCSRRARVRSRRRRCSASPRCTGSSKGSLRQRPASAWRRAANTASRYGRNCTPGCSSSAGACPMAEVRPGHSTTASTVGWRLASS